MIRGIFEGIHDTIPNLAIKENTLIPGREDIVVDYNHLIALEAKGVDDYYPVGLTDPISIKKLLSGIDSKADLQVAEMSDVQIDRLLRVIAEIGDYFDQKLDRNQAELLRRLDFDQAELIALLDTAKSSGPKGKIKLFVPVLKQLGVDISAEWDFKPSETVRKFKDFISGKESVEPKLKEGSEPKKLKE